MADNHSHGSEVGGIGLVTVLLALVFLFVWPGPLRYEYSHRPAGLVRVDRINGRTYLLQGGEYVKLSSIAGKDCVLDKTK